MTADVPLIHHTLTKEILSQLESASVNLQLQVVTSKPIPSTVLKIKEVIHIQLVKSFYNSESLDQIPSYSSFFQ